MKASLDRMAYTSLYRAVRACNLDAVKYLLNKGEDPNELNQYDETPFNIAAYGAVYGSCYRLVDSMPEKLDKKFVEIIIELLKARTIDPENLLQRRDCAGSYSDALKFFAENLDEICESEYPGLDTALAKLTTSLEKLQELQRTNQGVLNLTEEIHRASLLEQTEVEIKSKIFKAQILEPKINAAMPTAEILQAKLNKINASPIPQDFESQSEGIMDVGIAAGGVGEETHMKQAGEEAKEAAQDL